MLLLNGFQSNHYLYYDSLEEVTAGRLADSLLGLEALAERAGRIIGIINEVEIEEVKIGITSFEAGSYKEAFWVRFIFGKGRNGEKNIEAVAKACGLRGDDHKPLFAAVMTGLVLLAAWKWREFSSSKSPDVPPLQHIEIHQHFENSFNTIGGRVGIAGQQFRKILEQEIPFDDELIEQVSRMIHPGGARHVGALKIDGENGISLPPDILNSLPTAGELKHKKTAVKDLVPRLSWDAFNAKLERIEGGDVEASSSDMEGVQISVRAIDIDKPRSGGAVLVSAVSDKRLNLSIGEGIEPASIPIGIDIEADVTIFYKSSTSGKRKATKCLIRKVLPLTPTGAPAKNAE